VDKAQLKQRIVGAIVLVALGVIFIPMVLNRDDSNTGITGSNIPLQPRELEQLAKQTPPAPPPAPVVPAETHQLVDKDTPPLPQATPSLEQENSTPTKSESPAPDTSKDKPVMPDQTVKTRGWVVQVASFTDRNKALHLRDTLRKAKFNCFVESVTGKRGTLYRVRVGPVIKRQEADHIQARLTKQLKLKGTLVMAYP